MAAPSPSRPTRRDSDPAMTAPPPLRQGARPRGARDAGADTDRAAPRGAHARTRAIPRRRDRFDPQTHRLAYQRTAAVVRERDALGLVPERLLMREGRRRTAG